MTDLDRWFNELTHKYLETIRLAHLHCNNKLICVIYMVHDYNHIKNGNLNEYRLEQFARTIRITNTILEFGEGCEKLKLK